jgi:biopolymer transport protein ExbB
MFEAWWSILQRGGPVMWPLLGLSVVSLTLALERAWWFASADRRSRWAGARAAAAALRQGKAAEAYLNQAGRLYGRFLGELAGGAGSSWSRVSEARLAEAVESCRGSAERFLPTLSTIITAAPMLGVLGTVLGIIESFELIGGGTDAVGSAGIDPRAVGAGIAEALISTAAGLVVALLTLVPYNWLRGRAESAISRLEALALSLAAEEKPERLAAVADPLPRKEATT